MKGNEVKASEEQKAYEEWKEAALELGAAERMLQAAQQTFQDKFKAMLAAVGVGEQK